MLNFTRTTECDRPSVPVMVTVGVCAAAEKTPSRKIIQYRMLVKAHPSIGRSVIHTDLQAVFGGSIIEIPEGPPVTGGAGGLRICGQQRKPISKGIKTRKRVCRSESWHDCQIHVQRTSGDCQSAGTAEIHFLCIRVGCRAGIQLLAGWLIGGEI